MVKGLTVEPMEVETDRLIVHPKNANKVPEEDLEKIRAHIRQSGQYPRLIVRSLELSKAFAAEHAQGKLQMLDGAHRLQVLRDEGLKVARVDLWGGVTDRRARMLLLTLNHLRGKDDAELRAELIREHHADTGASAEDLAAGLPDSLASISKVLELHKAMAGKTSRTRAKPQEQGTFLTIQLSRDQERAIMGHVKKWVEKRKPRGLYPEGQALMALIGVKR